MRDCRGVFEVGLREFEAASEVGPEGDLRLF